MRFELADATREICSGQRPFAPRQKKWEIDDKHMSNESKRLQLM